jgi:hypothetical protein
MVQLVYGNNYDIIFLGGVIMSKTLTKLIKQKRELEQRVTKDNKDKLIKDLNKFAKDFGFSKLDKDTSINQIRAYRDKTRERLNYDILTVAIQEGNTIRAEIESRDTKKSKDSETARLSKYARQLANAKKKSDSKLNKNEKEFLEKSNQNILGYGNEDIITKFENTKTAQQALNLINSVANQNPIDNFYDKKIDTFERVFQKVGIYREEDLNKLKDKLRKMNFDEVNETTNMLLESLELYGSPDNNVGAYGDDETELANARLDDMLIRTGIKKTGERKVKKTMDKYKSKYNGKTGLIY